MATLVAVALFCAAVGTVAAAPASVTEPRAQSFEDRFRVQLQGVASDAGNATGREMSIADVDVAFETDGGDGDGDSGTDGGDGTASEGEDSASSGGSGPGFGLAVAVLAVLGAALLAARRQ